ncbi:MAG: tannase/feruloyl esterase family alpha/beta hydrolase, partial [Bradyrhizobiaceae bacterium]|nr:tannase/feruloyl esterase family alpha/beta hydrolase [Bradyrhizobiaceae bacterium]
MMVAAALAASVFAGGPSARAAETTCSGALGSNVFPATQTNIKGNVKIPDHASCTLYFVDVAGSIEVGHGSTLVVNGYNEPSTIAGNIVASQCAAVLLEGTITVGGHVEISNCSGSTSNGFVGPDVVIDGSFTCQGNSSAAAPCLAQLGKVHGDVVVKHNVSPVASDVSLVDIGGTLLCDGNSVMPTHAHGPDWVNGPVFENQCKGFSTTKTSIGTHMAPVGSCAALASLPAGGFPVPNTVIDSAVDTAASTPASGLPERCIVNGHINQHVSPVDNCTYQIAFQVQLPLPSAWNGRFMFQGGGGTEGSVPTATGTDSGSGGANYGIENGYAVASQNGGHNNTDLRACATTNPATAGSVLEFYLDPLGTIGQAFQSIEVTAITAKYLINA